MTEVDIEAIAKTIVDSEMNETESPRTPDLEQQAEAPRQEEEEKAAPETAETEETVNNDKKERPRASEILAIARREKALREKEASLETKAAEIAEQRVNEFIDKFLKDPQGILKSKEIPEDRMGKLATDMWYSQLDPEEQPDDYKQMQYVRQLENKITELESKFTDLDPKAAIQKAEQERKAASYLGELNGLAKNSEVIQAVFGENTGEVLWNTASQMYQATDVIPTATEVIEVVEKQMLEYVDKLSGFREKSPVKEKMAEKTLTTTETPRTRRRSTLTDEDLLKEAEALVKPFLENQ